MESGQFMTMTFSIIQVIFFHFFKTVSSTGISGVFNFSVPLYIILVMEEFSGTDLPVRYSSVVN